MPIVQSKPQRWRPWPVPEKETTHKAGQREQLQAQTEYPLSAGKSVPAGILIGLRKSTHCQREGVQGRVRQSEYCVLRRIGLR